MPRTTGRRLVGGLTAVALVAGLVVLASAPAAATPVCDPFDPDPPPVCGPVIDDPPFTPPADGFEWSRPSRFTATMASFHWDQATATYDPTHVHPSTWTADFDACATEADLAATEAGQPTANTYTWQIRGEVIARQSCLLTYDRFPAQGTYAVTLTITGPDAGGPFTHPVTIRDILIVSVGDSYASGEGNPVVPRSGDQPAQWVDRRCHRSTVAGPAIAAAQLERADPHTSVTFLSFACSGATIARPYHVPSDGFDYYSEDRSKLLGVGVLAPYRGAEPADPEAYDERTFIPPQIDQMVTAVTCAEGTAGCPSGGRRVDALLVSGGGNDIGFGPVAASCVFHQDCSGNAYVSHWVSGAGQVTLSARFQHDASLMPGIYSSLADRLDDTGLAIAETYVTEYPDPTTTNDPDDADGSCDRMLEDTNPIPFVEISDVETRWARDTVLARLNAEVLAGAQAQGWTYVDGISSAFGGHGYCAPAGQRWIRRAAESVTLQGPDDAAATTGTLHPTADGHRAYAERIVDHLEADLAALPIDDGPPPEDPPVEDPPDEPSPTVLTPPLGGPPAPGAGYRAESRCPAGMVLIGIRSETRPVAGHTTAAVARAVCWDVDDSHVGSLHEGPSMGDATGDDPGQTLCPEAHLVVGIEGRQGDFVDQIAVRCKPADLTGDPSPTAPFGGQGGSPAGPFDCPTGEAALGISGEVIDWNPDHLRSLSLICPAPEPDPDPDPDPDEDVTAPIVGVVVSPSPNAAGWHRADVTVTAAAVDDAGGSGVARIEWAVNGGGTLATTGATATVPVTAEGATTVTFVAVDGAGNRSTTSPATVRIDRTAPVIHLPAFVITTPKAASPYPYAVTDALDPAPSVTCTSSAAGSVVTVVTLRSGTCVARDAAGNEATATTLVAVVPATVGATLCVALTLLVRFGMIGRFGPVLASVLRTLGSTLGCAGYPGASPSG